LADANGHQCADDNANFSIVTEKFHFEFCRIPSLAVGRSLMSLLLLYTALRPVRRATDWSVLMGGPESGNIPLASEITKEAIVMAPSGTDGFAETSRSVGSM
jgi:hypothetical protein